MSTSGLIYEGPRTQQSLATDIVPASKALLEEKRSRNPCLAHLVAVLAERNIWGPLHSRRLSLRTAGVYRASGGFFDIFDDAFIIDSKWVFRRVGALVARQFAN